MHINKKKKIDNRLREWKSQYPKEWEIVCGVETTGNKNTLRVFKMLQEADLYELSSMMASRLSKFIAEDMLVEDMLK